MPGQQLGAADREQLVGGQPSHVKSHPAAITMAHRNVHVFAREVDVMHGGRNPKVDARVSLSKAAKPMDQPFGGEIRRRAYCQDLRALALNQALGADCYSVECIAQHREVFATAFSNDQPLPLAIEKLDA